MAPSATHIVALGGIRMMLASLPWGLTGDDLFWARFRGGDSYILVCFLATSLCSRDGFGGT